MTGGGKTDSATGSDPGWDFFVSYTAADREWAEWISWQLEDADYRVLVQAWDFVPGTNWHIRMQQGVQRAQRTIAVLSSSYLTSVYGQTEWQAAHAADPQGFGRKLLPIRVEDCARPGLLGSVVSIDLFNHDADKASRHLLDRVRHALTGRAKPTTPPAFPALRAHPPTREPAFPPKEAGSADAAAPLTGQPSPNGSPARPHKTPIHPKATIKLIYTLKHTFTGHTGPVLALSVLPQPDGHPLLASASGDHTVRLWGLTTGWHPPAFYGHTGAVSALVTLPLPDGRTLLASASGDHTVRLWDPTTRQPAPTLTGHPSPVSALVTLPRPDGHPLLATASGDHTVRLWDPTTRQPGPTLNGHTGMVNDLVTLPLPDGRTLLATASDDHTVRLWDPTTGWASNTLTGHDDWLLTLIAVPLPDGRTLLATASEDTTARLWDPTTGQQTGPTLTGHTGLVTALGSVPSSDHGVGRLRSQRMDPRRWSPAA